MADTKASRLLVDFSKLSDDEREDYIRSLTPVERTAFKQAMDAEEKRRCEESLYYFITKAWPILVPSEDFTPGWHIKAICEHLEAVARREIKRLIINIPPRHSKSTIVAIGFPAWLWLQDPGRKPDGTPYPIYPGTWKGPATRFMYASYSQSLSTRDSVHTRTVIESPWYQKHWGDRVTIKLGESEKKKFSNTAGGYRIATSVEGTVTGEGGDIICIDDPHNVREIESDAMREGVLTWFDQSASTRLNHKKHGAFVIIMQRVHQNDLCGHLLDGQPGVWDHLCLPAEYEKEHPYPVRSSLGFKDPRNIEGALLWPNRETKETLEQTKLSLGFVGAAGQLQQRPAPAEGGMFNVKAIELLEEPPHPHEITTKVRGWDFAGSEGSRAAYTVGVLLGYREEHERPFVILDVVRIRANPADVLRTFSLTAHRDGLDTVQDIPQDPGQSGKYQTSAFGDQLSPMITMYATPEYGAKENRASMLGAAVTSGKFAMVKAEWNDAFLEELAYFPNARFVDQVDASVRAYNRMGVLVFDSDAANTPAPVSVQVDSRDYY